MAQILTLVTIDRIHFIAVKCQPKSHCWIKDCIIITWKPGQNSALDTGQISPGVDAGNVIVQKPDSSGMLKDIPYRVNFAFAFRALYPDAPIHVQ